jgi:hypothetical protein
VAPPSSAPPPGGADGLAKSRPMLRNPSKLESGQQSMKSLAESPSMGLSARAALAVAGDRPPFWTQLSITVSCHLGVWVWLGGLSLDAGALQIDPPYAKSKSPVWNRGNRSGRSPSVSSPGMSSVSMKTLGDASTLVSGVSSLAAGSACRAR